MLHREVIDKCYTGACDTEGGILQVSCRKKHLTSRRQVLYKERMSQVLYMGRYRASSIKARKFDRCYNRKVFDNCYTAEKISQLLYKEGI